MPREFPSYNDADGEGEEEREPLIRRWDNHEMLVVAMMAIVLREWCNRQLSESLPALSVTLSLEAKELNVIRDESQSHTTSSHEDEYHDDRDYFNPNPAHHEPLDYAVLTSQEAQIAVEEEREIERKRAPAHGLAFEKGLSMQSISTHTQTALRDVCVSSRNIISRPTQPQISTNYDTSMSSEGGMLSPMSLPTSLQMQPQSYPHSDPHNVQQGGRILCAQIATISELAAIKAEYVSWSWWGYDADGTNFRWKGVQGREFGADNAEGCLTSPQRVVSASPSPQMVASSLLPTSPPQ
ncbi:hypothetical protein BDZ91DRAFT_803990 [Kalaharituber pfeilii]|nr:hypothetical protein BDZ91DRAFT_803990 [Kalaharituber pfeilii]